MERIKFIFNNVEYYGFIENKTPETGNYKSPFKKVVYEDENLEKKLCGFWQHGRTGKKRYYEPIYYNYMSKTIYIVDTYYIGIRKINCKYLLNIMNNKKKYGK